MATNCPFYRKTKSGSRVAIVVRISVQTEPIDTLNIYSVVSVLAV